MEMGLNADDSGFIQLLFDHSKAQFLVAGVLLGDEVFHHGALFCRVLTKTAWPVRMTLSKDAVILLGMISKVLRMAVKQHLGSRWRH